MLKFLGSGSAFNTKRGDTCAYFELGGELFLFDLGEDVFRKLIARGLLKRKSRINIFITHLHADHAGGLGTTIAYLYYKVFHQDMSNICIYYPSEAIVDCLKLQGVPQSCYNLFVNRWDELYLPGLKVQPEYAFYDAIHVPVMDCYSIEFMMGNEFSFFYSGDTNTFHEKLQNIDAYDHVYHEVTMHEEEAVHFSYQKLLEATKTFTIEQKNKIYLMHLEEDFDEKKAVLDGFRIAENEL